MQVTQTGYIGYDEFVDIMAKRIAERSPEEELRKAFELFDEEGNGRISLRNLKRVVRELGENLSDDDLQAMIEEFDTIVCHQACGQHRETNVSSLQDIAYFMSFMGLRWDIALSLSIECLA